jgi:hypothetical protein
MEILTARRNAGCLRGRSPISRAAAFALVLALANYLAGGTPDQQIDEYQVKAAFIYNFAKFIQWPSHTFENANEPIGICILGHDPFGHSLEDTVDGRSIEGHALVVRHIAGIKQVTGCQILFIGSAENRHPLPTLAEIRTPGILTIGESDASGAIGVIINFRLDGDKVRFDINLEAAGRENLKISSRLLSLAHIVEPTRK